ncbi:MAG: hypothetical protein QM730_27375 [Anaerolineales bacterium]
MLATLREKKWDVLLWMTVLIGLVLRFLPGLRAGFPLNDGGMFLSMIRDLRANHFLLPAFTSYNGSNIPFAYPPFGIYVAALLSSVFHISEIDILRWLPPLVATAILPAFYWLSNKVLASRPKAIIATALFAFFPGSSDWFIMGGGLTRSFGILFSLLALGYVYELFRDGKHIWLSILFCALSVLSHPEVGLQTAGLCFLLWLFYGRNIAGIKNAVFVALGTALLTAPWWLTVLLQHGFAPFQSVMYAGVRETLLASLFHTVFSMQGGLPILPLLSLTGMFVYFRKREFLLPAWAFLPFFVDPRNAPAIVLFPLVMLSIEGLYFLKEEFDRAYAKTMEKNNKAVMSTPIPQIILAVLLLYFLYLSHSSLGYLVRLSLTPSDREVMEWVKANTSAGSRFLLITNKGQISPMTDSYQEWFPALTERNSENTLQGKEWTLGPQFYSYTQDLVKLQTCTDITCLEQWKLRNNAEFDHILLQKRRTSNEFLSSLKNDSLYRIMYESDDVVIFSAKH